MWIAFVIWGGIGLVLCGIGVSAWRSEKPAGFYAGIKPPEVRDVRGYNRAVAVLWFAYAALFVLLGLPFLLEVRNKAWLILPILGTVAASFGLLIGYHFILQRYQKR